MPIPKVAEPPKRTNLAEDVYRGLLDDIVQGRLEPGAVASEQRIADDRGVSRSPVREAMARLAIIGLVEVAPRRGTRIAPLDRERYTDTVEALLPLLVESVHIVVPIADERQRRGLSTRLERRGVDASGLVRADGFFDFVMRVLGNDRAYRLFEDLVPHVRRMWGLDPASVPGGLTADEAAALRDAIDGGLGGPAADVVRAWFDRQLEGVR